MNFRLRRGPLGSICTLLVLNAVLACGGGKSVSHRSKPVASGASPGSADAVAASTSSGAGTATASGTSSTASDGSIGGDSSAEGSNGGLVDSDGDGIPDAPASNYLDARIRRLTSEEYDNSVAVLLGTEQKLGASFVGSPRQAGFVNNADIRVDGLLAEQLQNAASTLAEEAVASHLDSLAPCEEAAGSQACALAFVRSFASKAYRRPATEQEIIALTNLYQLAATEGDYKAGIQLVIEAVLQSPQFLYLTELGDGTAPAGGLTRLSSYEIATSIAYLVTGYPPDQVLLDAAASQNLEDPVQLVEQVQRLWQLPQARSRVRALIAEWLGIDAPQEHPLYPSMIEETGRFAEQVLVASQGGVTELLTADFTVVDAELAAHYGLIADTPEWSKVALTGSQRLGVMTQGSVLVTYAHQEQSAPVKRGALVRRKLLCQTIPLPDPKINANFNPPEIDGTQTTRERFSQHSKNAACSGCHRLLDPVGFAFENFDGHAAFRSEEFDKPIDASGQIFGMSGEPRFSDAAAMLRHLAASANVQECFARNVLRFLTYQNDANTEANYLARWGQKPSAERLPLFEQIKAYLSSDLFLTRRVP